MFGRGRREAEKIDLKALIRTIPDFPAKGIQFRDITTLIADGEGFIHAVEQMALAIPDDVDFIAAIEARGFLFAGGVAMETGIGLVPIRKSGKLPGETIGVDYSLEYGQDRLEIHKGAIEAGSKGVLIDDLIATGGTAHAAVRLVRQALADIVQAQFLVDLPDLGGAERLRDEDIDVRALVEFEGD